VVDGLGDARAAFDRLEWGEAYRLYSAAPEPLAFDDVDRLATAAYLTGDAEVGFESWARGHREAVDSGAVEWAARFGNRLAQGLGFNGDVARSRGWVDRTRRILEDSDIDTVESGHVEANTAMCRIFEAGDVEAASAHFTRAGAIGERLGDQELVTVARIGQGRCLIFMGDLSQGVALLDEAMVSIESDELSPLQAGDAYCTVIDACHDLFDMQRSASWTESFTNWCALQPDLVLYSGHCLLHRAEIMQLRGTWLDALAEVQRACERLARPSNPTLGGARYLEGELHRVRGQLDEAEDSYRLANELGCEPQPGMSLLRLAQGQLDAAEASIRRAVGEAEMPMHRARLLPAYVEVLLEEGDIDAARQAAEELASIAAALSSAFLEAQAGYALGAVSLAEGDSTAALITLRRAWNGWTELEAPYEAARTRQLIARACGEVGDHDTAALETAAAQSAFLALGAQPQVTDAGDADPEPPAGLTPRELEVLIQLAGGKTNRVIAEELFISEKTVASHVSHIFTKLGVSSRAAATAYAYERHVV